MIKEKTFLVRVDEPIHKEYKELCKKNVLNMSQRIRNFILKEINELKQKKNA